MAQKKLIDVYDALIIGGGFYGVYIAEHLKKQGKSVLVVEKENDFLQRASLWNQARVHSGYHYPRSILTGFRSRMSFPRFVDEFSDCILTNIEKYYAIGKILGNISARQFEVFCNTINVHCEPAPHHIMKLFNNALVEEVYTTKEYVFDAVKLKNVMCKRMEAAGVENILKTKVSNVKPLKGGKLLVSLSSSEVDYEVRASHVFNCTYSQINQIINDSNIKIIPLKHEMTEMCLVNVPQELHNIGITIMCGPFFSLMPFPPRGAHSLHHVRYTPHFEWYDDSNNNYIDSHKLYNKTEKKTSWPYMFRDIRRYVPLLEHCEYLDSIWEVKTILPRSDVDDSRPILFKANYGLKNFHCIIGGKIDNVYDIIEVLNTLENN